MLIYWVLFTIPAAFSLTSNSFTRRTSAVGWILFGVLLVIIVGLRHEVGGDWFIYKQYYEDIRWTPYELLVKNLLGSGDHGYLFLNWLASLVNGKIYLVNTFCGAILVTGIIRFSKLQPSPWSALLVSIPYLFIVIAMGYTRQSVSLGLEFFALSSLINNRRNAALIYTLIAILFHKSAIIFLPFVLSFYRINIWLVIVSIASFYIIASFMTLERYLNLWLFYIDTQMQSAGGPIRVAMNALPAIIYLFSYKKLENSQESPERHSLRRIWIWMSIASLLCIPFVFDYSTAIDRVAIYFMPIQLYVYSRIHRLTRDKVFRALIVASLLLLYCVIQFVWLNYATHAYLWLPYRNLLFI